MENFEELLQAELDKLPYEKHLDDGQYNDGQQAGFELGARWALRLFAIVGRSGQFCPNCYSRNIIAWGPDADKCTDCEYVWDV